MGLTLGVHVQRPSEVNTKYVIRNDGNPQTKSQSVAKGLFTKVWKQQIVKIGERFRTVDTSSESEDKSGIPAPTCCNYSSSSLWDAAYRLGITKGMSEWKDKRRCSQHAMLEAYNETHSLEPTAKKLHKAKSVHTNEKIWIEGV